MKPPATFETAAVFGVLSGGNPLLLHAVAVATTALASVSILVLVGLLIKRLVEDPIAALVAPGVVLVLPNYYRFVATGFRPKYLMILFGLLGVYLALTERPILAGMSGALAPGYWQLGVVYLLLVVWVLDGRRARLKAVAGGAVATLAVMVPIVAWGTLEATMVQTVVVPTLPGLPRRSLLGKVILAVLLLGPGVVPLLVGAFGLGRGFWEERQRVVAVGGLWFAFQAVAVDFDGNPDLWPLLTLLAVGFGFVLARQPLGRQIILAGLVAGAVVAGPVWIHVGPNPKPIATSVDSSYEKPEPRSFTSTQTFFWEQKSPVTCHYCLGKSERQWLQYHGVLERVVDGESIPEHCLNEFTDVPQYHWVKSVPRM